MPVTRLNDKTCLITGAASGIGQATAVAAAREGARLLLTDINAPALAQVAASIQAEGGTVLMAKAMDISRFGAVKAWSLEIQQAHGHPDVLMNIAGISIWGRIEHLEHHHWQRCVDVNLMGPIHVLECFVPGMIAAGKGGHIVNVSSAAGLFGLPWHAAYSASKFGLRGISEVLRFDLARHGIGVSLVCPGAVNTGLVDTVDIQGVDLQDPKVRALRAEFQAKAITPEVAAHAILKGIKANRYMVFTSRDIRLGYWLQRKWAWPYEWIMRRLNDKLEAASPGRRRG